MLDRSYIISEKRSLTADSILYEQSLDIGEAFVNIELIDSSRNTTLTSDYAFYDQSNNYVLLTKKALLREYSGQDTFYLHADTLLGKQDSIYDTFRAYYNVRSYRRDLQGLCDSAFYSTRDSVLQLFGNPILWADNQQISGQQILLYTKNQQPDYMEVEGLALLASKEDSGLFNQSSGRKLTAYFWTQGARVVIEGNPESIYLPRDEKQKILGMNRLENGSLYIFMDKEGKVERLKVSPQPKGKFYPLQLLTEEVKYLEHFSWPIHLRPTDPADVFRLTDRPKPKTMRPTLEVLPARVQTLPAGQHSEHLKVKTVSNMSFFKQRKPRKFDHQPIYYDAQKEARQERLQKAKVELGLMDEKELKKDYEKVIRGSFREAVPGGSRTKQKRDGGKTMRILVVLFIIIVVVYFLASRYAG